MITKPEDVLFEELLYSLEHFFIKNSFTSINGYFALVAEDTRTIS
jgi:hypothetical protein